MNRMLTVHSNSRTTNGLWGVGKVGWHRRPDLIKEELVSQSVQVNAWQTFDESTHRECPVIKPIVFVAFEEVRVSIGVLQCRIYVVWYTFPIRQWFRIC